MIVKILHGGRKMSGKVIYNFEKIKDVILIKFNYAPEGIEPNVLLYRDDVAKRWYDIENLENRYPDIFRQLLQKLQKVFIQA